MLVIEKLIDDIKNIDHEINSMDCGLYDLLKKYNHFENCYDNCDICLKQSLIMLAQEYKEPIELTQFEYDLLDSYVLKGYKFESCGILPEMHKKGYFKNVDTSMKIKEILENCVVKDDGN